MHMLSTDAYAATVTRQGNLLAYSSGGGVLRSRDRGETWRRVGLAHFVNTFLATERDVILAGTENGVFRSNDGGETWVERSIGLTTFRTLSLADGRDGTVYAGTSDGTVFKSTGDGDRWRPLARIDCRSGTVIVAIPAELGIRGGSGPGHPSRLFPSADGYQASLTVSHRVVLNWQDALGN
jgi:photosystem II stability/assembly factor-like uncharacterized protein